MTDPAVLWVISGIVSCLIFTFSERDLIRGMEFSFAMMLLVIYATLIIAGPVGLTWVLMARLAMLLGNL
jgi:hypothetical protein